MPSEIINSLDFKAKTDMKIVVFGYGAMGKLLCEVIEQSEAVTLVAGIEPRLQVPRAGLYANLREIQAPFEVLIDFSHPSNLKTITAYCLAQQCPLVLCTTGYSEAELQHIQGVSESIPLLLASNTSQGINLMNQLVQQATKALDADFDIEVIEKHHNKKLDAPSGTAKTLLQFIEAARQQPTTTVHGRSGMAKRSVTEVGVHSLRGGTIVGEHTVLFAGEDEIIEIKHIANSKRIFANGAVKAAQFLVKQENGFFTMMDVLNG